MTVLNLATKFGDLDLVVQPAGFPTGYEGLSDRYPLRSLRTYTLRRRDYQVADRSSRAIDCDLECVAYGAHLSICEAAKPADQHCD